MTIRVLLVDDHQLFRQGLSSMLAGDPEIQVVGEAENGRKALKLASEVKPDVIVMDVSMPDLNGIEATRQIKAAAPRTRVIALSAHSDRRFVARMLEAGATGYLLKDCAFDELARAIRHVARDLVYLSPAVAAGVVADSLGHTLAPQAHPTVALTPRQREVIQLIAEGLTTKQIAAHLHISAKTVETHRQQLMKKLDVQSIADVTKYALREGLTTLD
ncbi:MAG: response regulator transcription factor [Planctomycetota bacterium]|nr:response regulator transcription factor [Planctomycetota bacterium]